ncbi:MAG: hypothetical protein D6719_02495 [Candidatus Dadabacteria bacterium]|nr:MAG: hypothetical protein D6719_02495 [Candidatus Dadabacteria bacterium]
MTENNHSKLNTALDQLKKGEPVIIRDDLSTGKTSALAACGCGIKADLVNRILRLSGGINYVTLTRQRAEAFLIPDMPALKGQKNAARAALVSVEAREGVTTGISASDRARTISVLAEREPNPRKIVKPGHIFPLLVKDGGVLVKSALPEAAYDLVKAASNCRVAFFVELLNRAGDLMSVDEQEQLSKQEGIPMVAISDIIRYRLEHEKLVERVAEARLPTDLAGELKSYVYRSKLHEGEHLALVKGEIKPGQTVLARVQPEFTFGDVFGGDTPPTRWQLENALKLIGQSESGVLVYLRRTALGELRKQVSDWQQEFSKKPAAMMREYGLGAQILRDLGVEKIDLLTTSAKKLTGINTFGIEIINQTTLSRTHLN